MSYLDDGIRRYNYCDGRLTLMSSCTGIDGVRRGEGNKFDSLCPVAALLLL